MEKPGQHFDFVDKFNILIESVTSVDLEKEVHQLLSDYHKTDIDHTRDESAIKVDAIKDEFMLNNFNKGVFGHLLYDHLKPHLDESQEDELTELMNAVQSPNSNAA